MVKKTSRDVNGKRTEDVQAATAFSFDAHLPWSGPDRRASGCGDARFDAPPRRVPRWTWWMCLTRMVCTRPSVGYIQGNAKEGPTHCCLYLGYASRAFTCLAIPTVKFCFILCSFFLKKTPSCFLITVFNLLVNHLGQLIPDGWHQHSGNEMNHRKKEKKHVYGTYRSFGYGFRGISGQIRLVNYDFCILGEGSVAAPGCYLEDCGRERGKECPRHFVTWRALLPMSLQVNILYFPISPTQHSSSWGSSPCHWGFI